eukprot:364447-Chlamydomonas_euryale.AAC.1
MSPPPHTEPPPSHRGPRPPPPFSILPHTPTPLHTPGLQRRALLPKVRHVDGGRAHGGQLGDQGHLRLLPGARYRPAASLCVLRVLCACLFKLWAAAAPGAEWKGWGGREGAAWVLGGEGLARGSWGDVFTAAPDTGWRGFRTGKGRIDGKKGGRRGEKESSGKGAPPPPPPPASFSVHLFKQRQDHCHPPTLHPVFQ